MYPHKPFSYLLNDVIPCRKYFFSIEMSFVHKYYCVLRCIVYGFQNILCELCMSTVQQCKLKQQLSQITVQIRGKLNIYFLKKKKKQRKQKPG